MFEKSKTDAFYRTRKKQILMKDNKQKTVNPFFIITILK